MGIFRDMRNLMNMSNGTGPSGSEEPDSARPKRSGLFAPLSEGMEQLRQAQLDLERQQQQSRELLTTGISGEATVSNIVETGTTINGNPEYAVTVTVEVPNRAPYGATFRQLIPWVSIPQYQPGCKLPVKVSPTDPQVLTVG